MTANRVVDKMKIPLFPLYIEPVPGQQLTLRIFEPRYLALVKQVAGKEDAFGIVQILSGNEVGATPDIAAFGIMATIIDFQSLPDGVLGVTILGGRPFSIRHTWVQQDGLMMSHVAPLQIEQYGYRETNIGSDNAGPMDHKVAEGLGIPVEEYVQALLDKRVRSERLEAGSIVNGSQLTRTRVTFRYQGRFTFLELDESY